MIVILTDLDQCLLNRFMDSGALASNVSDVSIYFDSDKYLGVDGYSAHV